MAAKRLAVLVGILAVMLVTLAATVPAMAQGVLPPGGITAAGVLERLPSDGGPPVFGITDEASGKRYILQGGGNDISRLEGQRAYVEGVPRTDPNSGLVFLEVNGYTAADRAGPSSPPPSSGKDGSTATLSFELTVEGDPPAGTRFFGAPGEGGGQFFDAEGNRLGPVPLTDSDGDGVYTGSTTLVNPGTGPVVSLPVQIVRENGGNIEVIRDFGVVGIDGDKTFSASASFGDGGTTPGGGSGNEGGAKGLATATFELTVEGKPPADATFFAGGLYDRNNPDANGEEQLTDPDGDGVYTATRQLTKGDHDLDIEQGTGTTKCGPFGSACPGEPTSAIKDFGKVALDKDETFSASVSFESGGGGSGGSGGSDNGGSGKVGPDGGGSSGNGGSGGGSTNGGGSGSSSGVSGNGGTTGGGIRGLLPSTGGIMPYALGVGGVLLVGGGLLVRRLAR